MLSSPCLLSARRYRHSAPGDELCIWMYRDDDCSHSVSKRVICPSSWQSSCLLWRVEVQLTPKPLFCYSLGVQMIKNRILITPSHVIWYNNCNSTRKKERKVKQYDYKWENLKCIAWVEFIFPSVKSRTETWWWILTYKEYATRRERTGVCAALEGGCLW